MKYILILVCSFAFCLGCKQKVLSGADLDKKLIKTMQGYLDKEAKPVVTYSVKDVNYYADKENFDTTGIMKANIPNDFSKVERLQ